MRATPAFAILCCLMCSAAAPATQPQNDTRYSEVLFERPVGETGERLVVTRGPVLEPAAFKAVRPQPHPKLHESGYEVRVELRSPQSQPLLLAARFRIENGTEPDKGSVVLDSLVEPGKIALAMAEGSDLAIWEIPIGGGRFGIFWPDKYWSPAAARDRIDEKILEMRLTRAEDGRLNVTILDKRFRLHSLYEETEKNSLSFRVVRQWGGTPEGDEPKEREPKKGL